MKLKFWIIICLKAISLFTYCAQEKCPIVLESQWHNLDTNDSKVEHFGGKWVLVGSITFKRKSKEPIFLDKISFVWHGEQINNLIASLYKKPYNKEFLAIEENLICDGIWNEKAQTLIFDFDDQEKLAPTTTFYLVLTIPQTIESILKNGYFCLKDTSLSVLFKQSIPEEKLRLAINDLPHPNRIMY